MNVTWYVRRLSRMSAPEIARRSRDSVIKLLWRRHWIRDVTADRSPLPQARITFQAALPNDVRNDVDPAARDALIACADRILAGRWKVFTVERADVGPDPDWFIDPRTGRRGPESRYCFEIDHRAEEAVGNIKYVWELSRHHHLTVLAAAFYLTGDERYAVRAGEQLASWWRRNPFLSGVHWTSGIEVGIRLVSWVWVRRLLDGWAGVGDVFEHNETCLRQLEHHQRYLATLMSHHSSANNHVIAEAAGLFVAASAFPWFSRSGGWRARASSILRRELRAQTFPSGINRELASDYQAFVLELGLAAALEGEATGHPVGAESWGTLRRMTDAIAAMVDCRLRPPRQGDSDDGTALLLDDPDYNHWEALLSTGSVLFGALPWWPDRRSGDVRTALWTALARRATRPLDPGARPTRRPGAFLDAGTVLLRSETSQEAAPGQVSSADPKPEIWCRCDHGPLGFLSVAAHGHADALAIEVRHDGVDILADPGTYCYHGEREWRRYFKSTIAHNTLELASQSQSTDAGPFMWLQPVPAHLVALDGIDHSGLAVWEAEHDGYRRLKPPATHRRRVELDRAARTITVTDRVDCDGDHDCRLAFHLGPAVDCKLLHGAARLQWTTSNGTAGAAEFTLPPELEWNAVSGATDPPLGWYSSMFGDRRPSTVLIGVGRTGRGQLLRSTLHFD